MQRRAILGGLAAMLLPAGAIAQAPPPPGASYATPPMSPPPYGGQPGMPAPNGSSRQRTPVVQMSWAEIPPKRRRKLQQRLAGPGNPPLAPDQAQQMWDGMAPQQRRGALRASAPQGGGGNRRQQQMSQPPQ